MTTSLTIHDVAYLCMDAGTNLPSRLQLGGASKKGQQPARSLLNKAAATDRYPYSKS